jgi:hypothetical protein
MTIPKKGSRKIVLGELNYKWLIRRKGTDCQVDYGIGKIHVAIELDDKPNNTLIIYTDRPHPQDYSSSEVIPVTPADIKKWIYDALDIGWKPNISGPQFHVRIENGKMVPNLN